jgi:hypothetical protein
MQPGHGVQETTLSLYEIVDRIENRRLLIPQFQRGWEWDEDRPVLLFDSLFTGVFIGSIVIGPPTFDLWVREIDNRPRSGDGAGRRLNDWEVTAQEFIDSRQNGQDKALVLDGQQRITSIYRVLKGIEKVYFNCKKDLDINNLPVTVEGMMESVSRITDDDGFYIPLDLIFELKRETRARKVPRYIAHLETLDYYNTQRPQDQHNTAQIMEHIADQIDRYFSDATVSRQTQLNTTLDMFLKYFLRSNSTQMDLNFIDILVAKIYAGFKLRTELDDIFDNLPLQHVNTSASAKKRHSEMIVKTVALMSNVESIGERSILSNLTAQNFEDHFETAATCFTQAWRLLAERNLIFTSDDIPYPAMIIPIMMYISETPNHDTAQIPNAHVNLIEEWYMRCGLTERYSKMANTILPTDITALLRLAGGGKLFTDEYKLTFTPSRIMTSQSLVNFNSPSGSIPKTIFSVQTKNSGGLKNWRNNGVEAMIANTRPKKLDKHHIFPKNFIVTNGGNVDLTNSLMNFVRIAKTTNIQISDNPPQTYLLALEQDNQNLDDRLSENFIPVSVKQCGSIQDFDQFLTDRSELVWRYISNFVSF